MGMVVLAHYIGWGTTHCILDSNVFFSNGFILNSLAYPFFSTLCTLGVICFVMISGFFMCEGNVLRVDRIMKTWLPTVFYSVVFSLMALCLHKASAKDAVLSFFPIGTDQYWFVTKYVAIVLLSPFLNVLINTLSQRGFLIALAIVALLTITITMGIPYGNVFFSDNPFSVASFVLVYLIGAYIRKYSLPLYVVRHCWLLFAGFIILQGGVGIMINYLRIESHTLIGGFSAGYNALSLVPGTLLFIGFKNHRFRESVFVKFCVSAAPYCFGVYLIHENTYVRDFLWNGPFDMSVYWQSPLWLLYALLVPCLFLIIGCLIEFLRVKLFNLLGVEKFVSKVAKFNITIN